MQYYLCPRCQFKFPAKTRLCRTCGYEIPKVDSKLTSAELNPRAGASKKLSIWARLFGPEQEDQASGESGHEKPALG